MKKAVMVVLILVMAGCFIKPGDKFEKIMSNMNSLNGYHMVIDLSVSSNENTTQIKFQNDVDNISKRMVSLYEIVSDNSITTNYIQTKENKVIKYVQKDNNWYYINENITDPFIGFNLELLDTEKIDKNNYKIKLTYDQINNILKLYDGLENYKIRYDEVDSSLIINKDYIETISVNIPIDTLIDEKAVSININMVVNFSKFNEVSASIPEEVINNSRNFKIYEIKNVSKEYTAYIEQQLQLNQINTYIDNDVKYNEFTFKSVNLTLEDKISGFIEIDDYKVNITNSEIEVIKTN